MLLAKTIIMRARDIRLYDSVICYCQRRESKRKSEKHRGGEAEAARALVRMRNRRIDLFNAAIFPAGNRRFAGFASDVSLMRGKIKRISISCNLVSSVRFWVYVYVSITLLRTIDKLCSMEGNRKQDDNYQEIKISILFIDCTAQSLFSKLLSK